MANKPNPKKRHVSLRVNIETCRRVEKKFSRPDDKGNMSIAFIRALEESTRDIPLTSVDYEIIAMEVHRNEQKIKNNM